MLHGLNNQRLPAAAWITQSAVPGQASKAGCAVRKAHSEKQKGQIGK
jgi:hypothetical protein